MFLLNVAKKDEDGNMKSFEFLKVLNRFFFRGPFCGNIVFYCGWSLFGIFCTSRLYYIIPFIAKFFCGISVLAGSFTISTWFVSYFIYEKDKEEVIITETENEKYIDFINNDYDLFIDIYKNKTEEYFTTKSKTFLEELKSIHHHESYALPYSYNPKIIFYYNNDTQSFHYYSQSDVSYKILNSVCRTYTIEKKCIQLFQDEEEINYMKQEALGVVDLSFSKVVSQSQILDCSSTELADKEMESSEYVNIFYNKKSKKNQSNTNKKQQFSANKFTYKGNLEEYNKIFLKNNNDVRQTSYADYLAQSTK